MSFSFPINAKFPPNTEDFYKAQIDFGYCNNNCMINHAKA